MIKKNIFMQDQIHNRIEIIMQEQKIPLLRYMEELSIAVLLVAVFLLGVGI
jgi:hypothetical protein